MFDYYDVTKHITAAALPFVTPPTRFWQVLLTEQGTTRREKTWSGELSSYMSRTCNPISLRRELEVLRQKRREVQGSQVTINRDNRKSLENAIDMQLQLLQVLMQWTVGCRLACLFLACFCVCLFLCSFSLSAWSFDQKNIKWNWICFKLQQGHVAFMKLL